jgi:hypothetical protein
MAADDRIFAIHDKTASAHREIVALTLKARRRAVLDATLDQENQASASIREDEEPRGSQRIARPR